VTSREVSVHYRVLLTIRSWRYWLLHCRQRSLFPTPLPRLAELPAPVILRTRVHPLVRSVLFRVCHRSNFAQHPQVLCTFLGVWFSIATLACEVHLAAGFPHPAYVSPSAFLTLSTIYSFTNVAGLFHPAATYEIHSSGVVPRCRANTAHHCIVPSCC
jgi:hypothetical protein